jgi:nitroimidazol reductase NimA-like FMN-containing flavoprotein (pyridoxamine 5'-phosphate oxidase superfamily)
MTETEVWSFLEDHQKLFVGFTTPNGYPHVSPVWFCVLEGKIYFRSYDYKVKTILARSGKACCAADDGESYRQLRGVIIWGRSRVVTDKKLIERVNDSMNLKYERLQWKTSEMPSAWVKERRKERRSFVEIVPDRISSWDNRKLS